MRNATVFVCAEDIGRRADKQYIAEHYRIRDWEDHGLNFAPNYNITPDSFQPVVSLDRETGERTIGPMKWGLVPHWSKNSKAGFSSINTRCDKLTESGAWREPWKHRRCLIPAEFFYGWEPKNPEKPKEPTQRWAVAVLSLMNFMWLDWQSGAILLLMRLSLISNT